MRNVCLHARHYNLCCEFSTQRWVSDTETVIIPGKISKIPPQVPPTGRGKMPEVPLLLGVLRRDWRNRPRYRNEIVIGGPQQRRYGNGISRMIRGKEEIKNVGRVPRRQLKIRPKTTNVGEVNEVKVEGGVKTFWVATEKAVRSGDICGPFPEEDSKAGFGVTILNFEFEVKGYKMDAPSQGSAHGGVTSVRESFCRAGISDQVTDSLFKDWDEKKPF
ncbi:hypothetical protein E2C01_031882 [Portunus trituberculatus]|uniref:Uncharacterized protein n=1 Tax=Portunus trituberculatus TaxID=210409 RepID=A0A5B7EZ24_PORTR|nr:hypothetical protein [Portunus trituberculatus]